MGPWLGATQGRASAIHLSEELKAAEVAVWSEKGGFQERVLPLKEQLRHATRAAGRYEEFLNGTRAVTSEHQSDCEHDYRLYRQLSTHPLASDADRAAFTKKADALLRIRLYDQVRATFA